MCNRLFVAVSMQLINVIMFNNELIIMIYYNYLYWHLLFALVQVYLALSLINIALC
jgi:hypothetical protein